MDQIVEALKQKLKCEKCSSSYGSNRPMWSMVSCAHHTCHACYLKCHGQNQGTCPVCHHWSDYKEVPLVKEMIVILEKQRAQIAQLLKSERKRKQKDEIEASSSKKAFEEKFTCQSCNFRDFEQNLHLCETCHELKYENQEVLAKYAICANCTIRKHMRKGHVTLDFLPYLRAYQFKAHEQAVKTVIEEFDKANEIRKQEEQKYQVLNSSAREQFDQLTEIMRKSKSTVQLLQNMEKIKNFVEESIAINMKVVDEMRAQTALLQNNLCDMKKWNERRSKDCVEDEEIVKLEV